jgi:hypothetical protein
MKSKKVFGLGVASVVLVILVASAFRAGTVYAATGCFSDTNGNPYEVAICWLKANGIVGGTTFSPTNAATRATVAQWLYKQVQIPPTKGQIIITPGNSAWEKFMYGDSLYFSNYSTYTTMTSPIVGFTYATIQPSIPTALYGRRLQLVGVEFCYTASATAILDSVEVNTFTASTGAGSRTTRFSDATERTDSACRYYVLPTPVTLTPDDGVNFFIHVMWTVSYAEFQLARTTFVLQATGIKSVPFVSDSADTVILSETTGAGEGPSTTSP